MEVKFERNYLGSVMYVLFLMGSITQYMVIAVKNISVQPTPWIESVLIFPLSVALLILAGWGLFDSAWMNYDDEDKEKSWKTMRWVKFAPLFVLPILKLSCGYWGVARDREFGVAVAEELQRAVIILMAYLSLSWWYGRGLGRLFQPFVPPRTKVYTDEKGQKFEANLIGTSLSVVFIILPFWLLLCEPMGRIFLYVSGIKLPNAKGTDVLSSDAHGRLIADLVLLLLAFYTFAVVFYSCVKVTFFIRSSRNDLKFSPLPLAAIAFVFTDHLCTYLAPLPYGWKRWLAMMGFFIVNFVAFLSLISPPDSLIAMLFQPHIPLLHQTTDLPDFDDQKTRTRTNVVFDDKEAKAAAGKTNTAAAAADGAIEKVETNTAAAAAGGAIEKAESKATVFKNSVPIE